MMTRRKILLSFLAMAALALAWALADRNEPSYLGHPISYWIEPWQHHNAESPERTAAAFSQMDDAAVRWLMKQLDWRPSRMYIAAAKVMNSIISDFMSDSEQTPGDRREVALTALMRLGSRARTAIPVIEAARWTPVQLKRERVRGAALAALIKIRGDRLEPYLEQLKSARGNDWTVLVIGIGSQGTNAAAAVPILTEALNQRTNVFILPAIDALGTIHSRPELSIPVLVRYLSFPGWYERDGAIQALGKFGADAKPVWTNLIACLNHTNDWTRRAAAHAILQIDPERAAEEGVKLTF